MLIASVAALAIPTAAASAAETMPVLLVTEDGGFAQAAPDRPRLAVYADGRRVRGDPRVLPLAPHAEIVVAYGTRAELPRPLPSTYAFPAGL